MSLVIQVDEKESDKEKEINIDEIKEEKPKPKSSLTKVISLITALGTLLTVVVTLWAKIDSVNADMEKKNKETDFVLQQMLDDYNRRIIRLEGYLDKALEAGAFKASYTLSRDNYYGFYPDKKIRETLSIKKLKTPIEPIPKIEPLKTVKQYRNEYQQVQQRRINTKSIEAAKKNGK